MNNSEHISVLLEPSVTALVQNRDGVYLDATFGRGGHSRAILQKLSSQGRLFAIDQDSSAVATAQQLEQSDARFKFIRANFVDMAQELQLRDIKKLDGILFDLGISSPQIDQAERGFSFTKDGPLDMRMDRDSGIPASDFLDKVSERQLREIFWLYGEEKFARRIAAAIIAYRDKKHIASTLELADIIKNANPKWEKTKHPATRCFQALRIYLNRELSVLTEVLPQTLELLSPNAILAIISFHSLEDRIVKRFIRKAEQGTPPPLPQQDPLLHKIGKPIMPTAMEIASNPRARSAVLRIAQRTTYPIPDNYDYSFLKT